MEEAAVEEVLACAIIASSSFVYSESLNSGRRKRKYWVTYYFRERDQYGAYKFTLEERRLKDPFSHVYEVLILFFSYSRGFFRF